MVEKVNHPDHYGGESNPYEVIKVLRQWLTPEEYRGFLKGNAIKYAARQGKKVGEEGSDAAKGQWYMNELKKETTS